MPTGTVFQTIYLFVDDKRGDVALDYWQHCERTNITMLNTSHIPYLHEVVWHIQPIPWYSAYPFPVPEYYQNGRIIIPNGLSIFSCLILCLIFITIFVLLGSGCILMPLGLITGMVPTWVWITGLAVGSLWIPLLPLQNNRATHRKYQNWFPVRATCLSVATHWVTTVDSEGDHELFWAYRLLCEYTHQGRKYIVTPLTFPHFGSLFGNNAHLRKYLKKTIAPDGSCILWINPNNPLHTIFNKRPRIDTGKAEALLFGDGTRS